MNRNKICLNIVVEKLRMLNLERNPALHYTTKRTVWRLHHTQKRMEITPYNETCGGYTIQKTYEGYNTIKLMEVAVPDRVIRSQLARSTRLPGFTSNVKRFITVYIILVLFVLFLLVLRICSRQVYPQ